MPVQEAAFVVALKESGNGHLQVLLQFRQNTGLHDGAFAFPGGKRKHDETMLDAACRELYEETGLLVDRDGLFELCQDGGIDEDGTTWRGIFYLCVVDSRYDKAWVKEPHKHRNLNWVPINELPEQNAPSAVLKAISALRNICSKEIESGIFSVKRREES
jgi:8-oxo-dGTP pyrophosphatase MutT (NUDIX family)